MASITFQKWRERLTRRSILWRAMLHTVLVWFVTLTALTLAAYLVTKWVATEQAVWNYRALAPNGISYDQMEAISLYGANVAAQVARILLGTGLGFLCIAVLLAYSFARALTKPLFEITDKVRLLVPGRWQYRRTVTTQDEVEELDVTVADMAARLERLYEQLEAKVTDSTDRLKTAYSKDQTLFESITFGVLVLDTTGAVVEANAAAAKILKLKMDQVTGVSAEALLNLYRNNAPLPPEQNPVRRCLQEATRIGTSNDDHLNIMCKDGGNIAARIYAAPIFKDHALTGAIVLFEDITTQRQLDYMKNEFITLASHQLRTPLASMQWYLELLATQEEDSKLSEQQQMFVTELRAASRRMSDIVSGLMDASRLQNGLVQPVLQTVDLCKMVEDLSEDIKMLGNDKKLSFSVTKQQCPLEISTDATLINVVLQNVMSNAVKYSKTAGAIDVRLWTDKAKVYISVTDTGIGIPQGDQNRIFEKLFRAHNSRKLEVNGSGLGLYSSKMIIENLGGTISFESTEDQGSVFLVTLPLTYQPVKNNDTTSSGNS